MCLRPLEDLGDQLADVRVDQRLAAADADDRRAALVDRGQALLDRQLLLDRRLVLANPAAAGAGQVAGVQRLEHQHQREPLRSAPASSWRCSRPSAWSGEGKSHAVASWTRESERSLSRCAASDVDAPAADVNAAWTGGHRHAATAGSRRPTAVRPPAIAGQIAISGK